MSANESPISTVFSVPETGARTTAHPSDSPSLQQRCVSLGPEGHWPTEFCSKVILAKPQTAINPTDILIDLLLRTKGSEPSKRMFRLLSKNNLLFIHE